MTVPAPARGSHAVDTHPWSLRRGDLRFAAGMLSAYLLLILIGVLVLRHRAVMPGGNQLNVDRAVFTALNAATLSGFAQVVAPSQNSPGQWMILALMLGGTITSLSIGGLAVARVIGLNWSPRQTLAAAGVVTLQAMLVGAILLLPPGRSVFATLFNALSGFSNCGLWLDTPPDLAGWRTHLALLPLAVLGGLGLPVLVELYHWAVLRRAPSPHTRTVVFMTALLYVAGVAVIAAMLLGIGSSTRDAAIQASAAALNSRTLGAPLQSPSALPRTVQWVLILLMMIGASPGGTGAGIKATTLAVLAMSVRRALRGDVVGRVAGIAACWVAVYLALVMSSLIGMLWLVPQVPADRLLFLVVSAASNVGLSHDPISITQGGLYVLAGTMLLGRIAPWVILWWMVGTEQTGEIGVG